MATLEVIGLNDSLKAMRRADRQTKENIWKGLQRWAQNVIADAQRNLRANRSVATGVLRGSGKVQRRADGLDFGFDAPYASYVEFGRRAGKMPPVDALVQWFKTKHGYDDGDARTAGWALSRFIAKFGTKPHPFLEPAVKKNQGDIETVVQQSIR